MAGACWVAPEASEPAERAEAGTQRGTKGATRHESECQEALEKTAERALDHPEGGGLEGVVAVDGSGLGWRPC